MTRERCPDCGAPLVKEPDDASWCPNCIPIVDGPSWLERLAIRSGQTDDGGME